MNEEEGVDCRCVGENETGCEQHCNCAGCVRRRVGTDYQKFYYAGAVSVVDMHQ